MAMGSGTGAAVGPAGPDGSGGRRMDLRARAGGRAARRRAGGRPPRRGAPGRQGGLVPASGVRGLTRVSSGTPTRCWRSPSPGFPRSTPASWSRRSSRGGLTVPIASHVHRLASDGGRVLFGVDGGGASDGGAEEEDGILSAHRRMGRRRCPAIRPVRRAWNGRPGSTTSASPQTTWCSLSRPPHGCPGRRGQPAPCPSDGCPGARAGSASCRAAWRRVRCALDPARPCLVTHVLGAYDEPDGGIVLYVCRYGVPELGQPVDRSASVVGPAGLGLTGIGGTLGVMERWLIAGERFERMQIDDRFVEYPRLDRPLRGCPVPVRLLRGDGMGGRRARAAMPPRPPRSAC